jgi:hypothetical protein
MYLHKIKIGKYNKYCIKPSILACYIRVLRIYIDVIGHFKRRQNNDKRQPKYDEIFAWRHKENS